MEEHQVEHLTRVDIDQPPAGDDEVAFGRLGDAAPALDAAGNAVYHSNPNSVSPPGATDTFTYTIRDSDGDESTTTITIDVSNSKLCAVSDTDVTVYEKALDLTKDGQDLAPGTVTGSDPTSTGETASGTLVGSVTGAVGVLVGVSVDVGL